MGRARVGTCQPAAERAEEDYGQRTCSIVAGRARTLNAGAGAVAPDLDSHALHKLGAEPVSSRRTHEDGRDVEGARVRLTNLGGRPVGRVAGRRGERLHAATCRVSRG